MKLLSQKLLFGTAMALALTCTAQAQTSPEEDVLIKDMYQKVAQVEHKKKPSWRDRLLGNDTKVKKIEKQILDKDIRRVETQATPTEFAKILDTCRRTTSHAVPLCVDKALEKRNPLRITKGLRSSSSIIIPRIIADTPRSSNVCSNGSFEQNFSDWTGFRGWHDRTGLPIENQITPSDSSTYPNKPFLSTSCEGDASGQHCLAIETGGTDIQLANANTPITLNRTFSGKSARLGGWVNGNNLPTQWSKGRPAEGLSKRFVVTPANETLNFKYAIVGDESHSDPTTGNINGSEAFFQAVAIDMQGNVIDKIDEVLADTNPFVKSVGSRTGKVFYRDWTCASLDLSSAAGQEVVVYFLNSDCSAGGHSAHTFIDDVCGDCAGDPTGAVDVSLKGDDCLNEGETDSVEGTITVPQGASNVSVEIKIFKNGAQVGTLGNASINGSGYSLPITRSDFPSLDCFDLVSELTFSLPDMNGNLQTVSKESSGASGFEPGQNNDICLNCTTTSGGDGILTGTIDHVLLDPILTGPVVVMPTLSDCCPPLSDESILPLFTPEFQGPATGPYRMKYRQGSTEVTQLNNQMQAYINYLNSLDSSITSINLNVRVHDRGPIGGPVNPGNGPQPSGQSFLTWTAGSASAPLPSNGGGNFWNSYDLQPNQEYKIHVGIYLNDNKKFFSDDCSVRSAEFHWQVSGMRIASGGGGTATGEFKFKRGGKMQSLGKKSYKLDSKAMRQLKVPARKR